MMKMYFRLLLILCFLCCLPACQDKGLTFHEWNADLAMKKAQEKQQAVFLFVYQDEDDPYVKVFFDEIFQDEQIATLCDIAMCGDHGIGEAYGAVLDLPKCIAKGDDICSLRYHKVKK